MNEHEEIIAVKVGEKLGEVTTALIAIAQTLKNQPGFDRAAFDQEIRHRMSALKDSSLMHVILSAVLDDVT